MDHHLTSARNKVYQTKWALWDACRNPRFFYGKWKEFLEVFYVDTKRRENQIRSVPLSELIPSKLEVTLSNFQGRDGNVTIQELLAIVSLIRHHNPKVLLELGTFDGNTTLQMALNSSDQALVHTLDLPPKPLYTKEPVSKADLKYILDAEKSHRKYLGTPVESKIIQHFGDSTNFDFTKFIQNGPVDFIFIDAGHTYQCVKSDTLNALQILSPQGVIVWHDCHPFWNGVYTFLNELAHNLPIIHIAGTNLAYCYRRDPPSG